MRYQETTPCVLCGTPTPMLHTKRCNGCWELEGRIQRDPELARKILAGVDTEVAAAPDMLAALKATLVSTLGPVRSQVLDAIDKAEGRQHFTDEDGVRFIKRNDE